MTITQGIQTKTLKELKKESGRSSRKILDDVVNGSLRACIQTISSVIADDHIKRHWMKFDPDSGKHLQSSQARVLWLTSIEAGELRRHGNVDISYFEYPVFIDSSECPAVKRYKKERATFAEPYAATIEEICFLDGDAIHYISKHTGRPLVPPKAIPKLPRIQGSSIIYRLWASEPGQANNEENLSGDDLLAQLGKERGDKYIRTENAVKNARERRELWQEGEGKLGHGTGQDQIIEYIRAELREKYPTKDPVNERTIRGSIKSLQELEKGLRS